MGLLVCRPLQGSGKDLNGYPFNATPLRVDEMKCRPPLPLSVDCRLIDQRDAATGLKLPFLLKESCPSLLEGNRLLRPLENRGLALLILIPQEQNDDPKEKYQQD